jgi:cold shock CspA family protein
MQIGDLVHFRVGASVEGQNFKAVRIKVLEREPTVAATATVDAIKEGFGFINFIPEGSGEPNLFFHFSSIVDDSGPEPGDTVSFEVGRNPKNARFQAVNVKTVK